MPKSKWNAIWISVRLDLLEFRFQTEKVSQIQNSLDFGHLQYSECLKSGLTSLPMSRLGDFVSEIRTTIFPDFGQNQISDTYCCRLAGTEWSSANLIFVKTGQFFKVISCAKISSKAMQDGHMSLVISLKCLKSFSQLVRCLLKKPKTVSQFQFLIAVSNP